MGNDIHPTVTYSTPIPAADADAVGMVTYTFRNTETDDEVAEANLEAGTYKIRPAGLSNDNYNFTPVDGTLTITAGQIIAQVKPQTVEFGTAFAANAIQHYSGLAESKVVTFNSSVSTSGLTFKIYKEDGTTEAETVEGKDYYPAGTYKVKATGTTSYPGYEGDCQ